MALLSCCPFLDVNQQDKEGDTALMLAAQAGVRLLTPPSPKPLPPSWAAAPHFLHDVLPPHTPLGWVEGGFGASSLLSRRAEICLWCSAGHVPLVSLLLSYYAGLDLERRDQRGLTVLMKAAMRDRSECVAALLMAGA